MFFQNLIVLSPQCISEVSKGLLKSKLQDAHSQSQEMCISFFQVSAVVKALQSLYSLAVDTLLPLYTFTLHKTPLNS